MYVCFYHFLSQLGARVSPLLLVFGGKEKIEKKVYCWCEIHVLATGLVPCVDKAVSLHSPVSPIKLKQNVSKARTFDCVLFFTSLALTAPHGVLWMVKTCVLLRVFTTILHFILNIPFPNMQCIFERLACERYRLFICGRFPIASFLWFMR